MPTCFEVNGDMTWGYVYANWPTSRGQAFCAIVKKSNGTMIHRKQRLYKSKAAAIQFCTDQVKGE